MLLVLALSFFFISPWSYSSAVDVRPENEVPQVVGSEVKVLPGDSSEPPPPRTSAPAAPIFSEPLESTSELPVVERNTTLVQAESTSESSPSITSEFNGKNASTTAAAFEFEPNVTDSQNRNASLAVDELSTNSTSTTLKSEQSSPPPNNETVIDVDNQKNESSTNSSKNESQLINDLLVGSPNANNATEINNENEKNSTNSKFLLPSKVPKLRLTVIGFTGKPVHTFNLSEDQTLYQMKVFWGEPDSWQDIGWRPSDRLFELFCWLTTNGGFSRDLFRGNLSASLITHSQWYAFPETEDPQNKGNVACNCGIRPVNGASKSGDWTFSDSAPIRDAPVFLRGFENVNVRGWTKDEVVRLVQNQKRQDSPQQAKNKANGQGQAGKNRGQQQNKSKTNRRSSS